MHVDGARGAIHPCRLSSSTFVAPIPFAVYVASASTVAKNASLATVIPPLTAAMVASYPPRPQRPAAYPCRASRCSVSWFRRTRRAVSLVDVQKLALDRGGRGRRQECLLGSRETDSVIAEFLHEGLCPSSVWVMPIARQPWYNILVHHRCERTLSWSLTMGSPSWCC